MDAADAAHADRINRYWDGLVRGESPPQDGLDPIQRRQIDRLHALAVHPLADPVFVAHLKEDVMAGPKPFAMLSPRTTHGPSVKANGRVHATGLDRAPLPPTTHRWRPSVAALASAAAVLLTLAATSAAYRLVNPAVRVAAPVVAPAPTETLYAAAWEEDIRGRRLVAIDPTTLADVPGAATIETEGAYIVVSADGTTLVTVDAGWRNGQEPEQTAVVVRDGATGRERHRFDLPFGVNAPPRVSRDGSRLVVAAAPYQRWNDPPAWHVVDTTDGRVLATVAPDVNGRWTDETWIDADATRLYGLLLPHTDTDSGPGPARIIVHDLRTGAEAGRLDLPGVRGGTWMTGRTIRVPSAGDLPVVSELRPGVALSPDGRQLAFVHADEEAITVVNAERLAVERTVRIARPRSLLDRLAGLLPLVPETAEAKLLADGTTLSAVFAADGRRLYVTGHRTTNGDDGQPTTTDLGLRAIWLADGAVVAETSVGSWLAIEPSTDGRSLYVSTSLPDDPDGDDDPPMLLRRLDAETLAVRAERTFPGYPGIVPRPSVPNGSDAAVV